MMTIVAILNFAIAMPIKYPMKNTVERSIKEDSMKMMQTINRMIACGFMVAVVSLPCNASAEDQAAPKGEPVGQHQEPGKWQAAGQEVKEAAGSVAEATTETAGTAWDTVKNESIEAWEKTRSGSRELFETAGEKSKEAWHVTQEESKSIWEKSKAKIHEITAPSPPVAPYAPAAPAAKTPSVPADATPPEGQR
jgi:hypothetical protein